ncbi:MAG: hypothetical protein SAL07_21490 [Oscillatoria sp. PMC 1051.18]|nr:hypothetical protein [Oscillatoria sp. PMC 1050.18]MEC5032481.1 hypothetical protein [Oscillatoria sp. PMC 1051.18]
MAYSDFTLNSVIKTFSLTLTERVGLFAGIPELKGSSLLKELLDYNLPLALGSNTEKARSELLISPVLIDLRKQLQNKISWFSGIEFSVAPARGLNGSCDFIISRSPELFIVRSPVIVIVEAKKENINGGLGQCVAEMLAAKIFNEQEENEVQTIYGAVTTGTNWKFLKLTGEVIEIDTGEYFLNDVDSILGILASGINNN